MEERQSKRRRYEGGNEGEPDGYNQDATEEGEGTETEGRDLRADRVREKSRLEEGDTRS
jgi:hypothetical protein